MLTGMSFKGDLHGLYGLGRVNPAMYGGIWGVNPSMYGDGIGG